MKTKRFAIALSLILCLSFVFTACQSSTPTESVKTTPGGNTTAGTTAGTKASTTVAGDPNVNEKGVFPIVKKQITLSMFFVQSPQVDNYVNNDATKYVEEKTNIKINWVLTAQDSAAEKKQILIAGNDYPDIFNANRLFGFTNDDVVKFGSKQGIFIPINDLMAKYGDAITAALTKYPDIKARATAPDGKLYGMPMTDAAYHTEFYQKMWMNNAWITKLGLKLPTTTDEFTAVLKAFRDGDPNGNGKKDEIPLTGCIKQGYGEPHFYLMNSFIYCDKTSFFMTKADGKLGYAPVQDEWREGIRYMNMLYNEKLLSPSAFTQTIEQQKSMGTNPDAVIIGATAAGHAGNFLKISDDPIDARQKDYVSLPPMKGPKGVQIAPRYSVLQPIGLAITDKCKNPEAAFRFIDFLTQVDTTIVTSEGLEGKTWKKAVAGEKNILGQPATYTRIGYTLVAGAAHTYNWGNNGSMNRGSELDGLRGQWTYSQDELSLAGFEVRLFNATKNNYQPYELKNQYMPVFLPVGQIDEAGQLKVAIEEYVNQSLVRFITGDLKIESDWDSYKASLTKLNLEKYLEIYGTAWMNRAK